MPVKADPDDELRTLVVVLVRVCWWVTRDVKWSVVVTSSLVELLLDEAATPPVTVSVRVMVGTCGVAGDG